MLGTFPTSASMQDALETMPRGTHEKLTDTQSVFSSVAPSLPASDVTDGARRPEHGSQQDLRPSLLTHAPYELCHHNRKVQPQKTQGAG